MYVSQTNINKDLNRINILFLMKAYEIGGQEVVTSVLAKSFNDNNHNVYIACFNHPNKLMVERTYKDVKVYNLDGFKYSESNVTKLRDILISEKIDIAINQWGLPFIGAKVLDKARKGLNVKVIAIYHNDPGTNARIKDVEIELSQTHNRLKRALLMMKKNLFYFITSRSMRYVYNHSDVYQVLSPSFVERFKDFTGIKNPQKLMVQTNPVTIETRDFVFKPENKDKEIIYVGRIDYNQKRVYRVIDTWALLEDRYPDWKLTIVGDGVERKNLENKAEALSLKHISFEGFQSPIEYYKRARILMLTSEYEGFGLVLVEGMSFGVVPAVYGSYSAVYDIVDNGMNGIVFPYNKEGFSAEDAARQMERIMADETIYKNMAEKAIETSKRYSVNEIYKSWKETFDRLCK